MSARVCVLYRIVYTRYVYSCTSTQFQIYSEKALFPFIFSINITLMRHRQTQKNAQYGVCFVVCWLPLSYPHITSIYGERKRGQHNQWWMRWRWRWDGEAWNSLEFKQKWHDTIEQTNEIARLHFTIIEYKSINKDIKYMLLLNVKHACVVCGCMYFYGI